MDSVFFTQLTVPEIRKLFRDELNQFFEKVNQNPESQDVWFSVDELREYLPGNPAKPTIYALTSKRQIPHSKRGKRLVFLKSEIDAWLKAGNQKTVAEIQAEVDRGYKK